MIYVIRNWVNERHGHNFISCLMNFGFNQTNCKLYLQTFGLWTELNHRWKLIAEVSADGLYGYGRLSS